MVKKNALKAPQTIKEKPPALIQKVKFRSE